MLELLLMQLISGQPNLQTDVQYLLQNNSPPIYAQTLQNPKENLAARTQDTDFDEFQIKNFTDIYKALIINGNSNPSIIENALKFFDIVIKKYPHNQHVQEAYRVSGLIYVSKAGKKNFRIGFSRLKKSYIIASEKADIETQINAAYDIGRTGYVRIKSGKSGIPKSETLDSLKTVWLFVPKTDMGQKAKLMYDELMQKSK